MSVFGFFPRRAALAAFSAAILSGPALAADRPATPEGARAVQAFLDRFLPPPAPGGPRSVSVTLDGDNYIVSGDLAAVNAALKAAGTQVSYDPAALVYRLTEQDDGKWRLVQDGMPRIVSHVKDGTSAVELANFRQTIVIDPSLAWFVGGDSTADKGSLVAKTPNLDQTIDFGPLRADLTTTVGSDQSVSSAVKETIESVAFRVAGTSKDGKPVDASGRTDKAEISVGVDGLKSRALYNLLALLSAHRGDLDRHETELKDLLRPLAAPGLKFAEGGEVSKLLITTPMGAVALRSAKLALGLANAGPESALDAAVTAEDLSLPVGLVPPAAADLTPSKIDLTITLSGFDVAAGANTAIDNLHLEGPGPALSTVDSAKVSAALLGSGPLKVTVRPSHILAPALDADLEGALSYAAGKTSGAMTVRMRNFDKTMNAIKSLGADVAQKALPALAMAKGLAQNEADGALSWRIEVGDDRSITINGVPFGKAP